MIRRVRLPRVIRMRDAWARSLVGTGPGEAMLTLEVRRLRVEVELNTNGMDVLARMLWQHHDREQERVTRLANVLRRPVPPA